MSKKALIGDSGIFEKLKADIQDSIDKKRKTLAQVEAKIEEQRATEKRLKMEVAKKEKEVDENERFVGELKKSILLSAKHWKPRGKFLIGNCARSIRSRKDCQKNARSVLLV